MKDQHTLIKGYRDLSQQEIDLINKIKICEAQVLELLPEIGQHLRLQRHGCSYEEDTRIIDAGPDRWLSVGRTHIEQGFMALVRAVAQPMPPRLEKDHG